MLANTENFARMGVLALLQEDREKWRQSLVASHAALVVVLFVFVLCAWTTDNTCYMTPCAVGTGLETVWKVSEWTVFTSLVAGAWSITIASAGLMLFYKYLDDPRCEGAHMAVGLFGDPLERPEDQGRSGVSEKRSRRSWGCLEPNPKPLLLRGKYFIKT